MNDFGKKQKKTYSKTALRCIYLLFGNMRVLHTFTIVRSWEDFIAFLKVCTIVQQCM